MEEILNGFDFHGHDFFKKITCIDMHTGGEPLRIPIHGLPEIKGENVLEKRRYFQTHFDHLRTGLMFEPRGHADMYGAILSDPSTPDADFDVFFIHNEGYSTMCGHAIIALTKFVFETQLLVPKHSSQLVINVPAGQVKARAKFENGIVKRTYFTNVPSFLYLQNKEVEVNELGQVKFDVAFGGAFYAFVDADQLNISMDASNHNTLIHVGKLIKHAVMSNFDIIHPTTDDLSFLYGTIFTGSAFDSNHHSRNVCIFAEGELDRSATGSGVSARASLHYTKGELGLREKITIESILGSTMTVEVKEEVLFHGYKAVIPEVSGTASFVGKNEFWFDPSDDYRKGFIFR
ncbi:MAG: proline racemase family protein [Saprospiraceae bacterium]|nr:proline racemase family protein [Saprospiraceae bacterium]